ncbi:DUF1176 domain-containing protein [Sphingorhabdus pulchriflava]|nr:DUF1176 domain-containing protein [Sphingorhabdus pulchriflava]
MMPQFLPLAAILSQSLYSEPQPEDIAVYQNWITGCDNMRNCAAVALQAPTSGTDGNTDHLEAMVEIPLAAHIAPTVAFRFPATLRHRPDLRIFVDQLEVPLSSAGIGHFKIAGAKARRIVQSMRKGQWVYLRDVKGEAVARTSLAGLTAALLRIDKQQGKLETPDAIVRRGKRIAYDDLPGYSVSLSRPAVPTSPPTEPKSKALDDNREQCGGDAPEETSKPSFVRLDSDNSLAIVPWACGSGAYVRYSSIMIISNQGEIRPAEFDYDNGITGDGPSNVQAEVIWLEKERVLESATRFRAIGDCGRTDRYIWDGYKFRLSEQLVMPECRGSFDRIRVWKTEVADR